MNINILSKYKKSIIKKAIIFRNILINRVTWLLHIIFIII